MNSDDRRAIEALFARLAEVERRADAPDPEAAAFIADQIRRRPNAAYYMAQTIVVQQRALEAAQARLDAEDGDAADPRDGGRFGGMAAGGRPAGTVPSVGRAGGGGFLAGAAQTAMGVAGGVLLGNMLGGLFSSGPAGAAEPPAAEEPPAEADPQDAAADDGGGFFDGWFDGGGDGGDDF